MFNAEDDDLMKLVIDSVKNPVGPSSRRPDSSEVVTELLTHSMGVAHECRADEVDDRSCDSLGKFLGDCPLRRRGQDKFVVG